MRELEFRKKKWTQELQLPLSSHSSPHPRTTEDIAWQRIGRSIDTPPN
jgi:hypothetical protein